MNFIKKVHDRKFDEEVHLQFQRFSKGEFKNRAILNAKFSGGRYTINTSAEFANELVKEVAEKLGSKKTKVSGAIISTLDLKKDLEFKEIKQFQGVKKYILENEMSGSEIVNLINKFPKAFFALSFDAGDETILKTKVKSPKSGKPGTKGEEAPKPDFCKLVTKDKKIAENFIFEKPEFKNAKVVHDFIIENIKIPDELKDSEDFALVREKALRIGKILRKAEIDGEKLVRELDFSA
ncbi:MAG: hypothetical protein ABIE36_00130 [Candidatus Diapherotrites archaeon]